MLNKSKSINVSGSSTIEVNGEKMNVMNVNANISESGSVTINKNIHNKEIYKEHAEEIEADFEEFETFVDSLMGV